MKVCLWEDMIRLREIKTGLGIPLGLQNALSMLM